MSAAPLSTVANDAGGALGTQRVVDLDADRKAWSTLVALAAFRGYALWRTDAGDGPQRFVLARWGVARIYATRLEVEDFLDLAETAR